MRPQPGWRNRAYGERARTVGQLRLFAQVAREGSWVDARLDSAIAERQPQPKPNLRRMLVPIGPVVVFGARATSRWPSPWPAATPPAALAVGNPVVVKAHSGIPAPRNWWPAPSRGPSPRAACPPASFSMLHGAGKVLGLALVCHPLTRAVGFTGSRAAGRALFDATARPGPSRSLPK